MTRILSPLLFLGLLASGPVLHAQQTGAKAKGKSKANQTNTDDMWVANPIPDLPAGVTHHTFTSPSMKREVGYCIYLPPGYEKDKDRRYPVIYHLHGAGGNEVRSLYSATVLHEGILAGKLPEIIMVFPNGGVPPCTRTAAMGASWPRP